MTPLSADTNTAPNNRFITIEYCCIGVQYSLVEICTVLYITEGTALKVWVTGKA